MKKFINSYDTMIEEMLAGFAAANVDKVVRRAERVMARRDGPLRARSASSRAAAQATNQR